MRNVCIHSYNDIISLDNLLTAWENFLRGKKNKKDVQEFQQHLMDNIIGLHKDLKSKTYTHGSYKAFKINDPKPRNIHKAMVRDRLLHHAIYQVLYSYFNKRFIHDSYSCRDLKGTFKAIGRLNSFYKIMSSNGTKNCWVLKCDIKRFFDSIDHEILISILRKYIVDKDILWLLERIIRSFEFTKGKGLPLGNLTSQLLVNIYMNEFDQFVKHTLKVKFYIRYADDFVFLSNDRKHLYSLLPKIEEFLLFQLKLVLHPNKIKIQTIASGVDFLGWVHFPGHRILRTVTKKRMLNRLSEDDREEVLQSYLGLLSHGNTQKIKTTIESSRQ